MRHGPAKLVALALFAMALTACGGGEDPKEEDKAEPAKAGAECNADLDTPCVEGFVCEPDGEGTDRCQRPVGASCDPTADENFCLHGSDCFEVSGGSSSPDAGMSADAGTADAGGPPSGECLITRGNECDAEDPMCAPDLTCAEKTSGGHACFSPVVIRGSVRDSTDDSPIEGAHIIGLDEKKVAVTDVADSDAEGNYTLALPIERNDDGSPIEGAFTLRADAADYQTFPSGLRQALPLNTSEANKMDGMWVIEGTPSEIVLIPLPSDQQGNPSISGSILADDNAAGVLVVAEGNGQAVSAVSDKAGNYTIFNVPSGSYTVRGYAADLQLEETSTSVSDEPKTGVDLKTSGDDLSTVSGDVNIVNAPGGAVTSVVLIVKSTFDEEFIRGEVPPGLRAPKTGDPNVEGSWTIEGVPDGEYVVLAAFENDDLVRDPDETIAGTDIVSVTVPDGGSRDVSLDSSFKVTESLGLVGPGQERPEAVSSAPTLTWTDDSSEDYYNVKVFNAYGDMVWEKKDVPRVTGGDTVTVSYGGPTKSGMYYQFRATSWKDGKGGGGMGGGKSSPISTTEDLRGVFYFE